MTDTKNIVHLVTEELNKPLIRVKAGQLPEIATKAEAAIIKAGLPIYRRGSLLVRPVIEEVDAAQGRKATVAVLHPLVPIYLCGLLALTARWERFDVRKNDWLPTNPPADVAALILARYGEWSFSPIAGILSTPTLRPEGTILSKPGYDPDSRLYLANPPELPPIPAKPTKDDALAALTNLDDLLE